VDGTGQRSLLSNALSTDAADAADRPATRALPLGGLVWRSAGALRLHWSELSTSPHALLLLLKYSVQRSRTAVRVNKWSIDAPLRSASDHPERGRETVGKK
jgi:hypothetical protein